MDIGHGVALETVDEICYRPIGHTLYADEGCDSVVTHTDRSAWKKVREYLPKLTVKGYH